MHIQTYGSKKSPKLVILHGWGIDGTKFSELAKILAKHFYVVVPDLPGFGKSIPPRKAADVSSYARAIKKQLKELKISEAAFIGHSFGGRIAIKLSAESPDLISSLVLTGAAGVEAFQLKRSLKRTIYWMAAKILRLFSWIPLIAKIRNRFYAKRDFGKVDGVMKETFLKVITEKLDPFAKSIHQQTLLLWGSRDQLTLVCDAEKLLKIIPNAYLKIFSGVGHNLPYKRPHEFAREVKQFLL